MIDGDELRTGLCKDLGYDDAGRAENVRRAAHMARLLNDNAINAVVAMISPATGTRAAAYATIGLARCKEIFVCTPLEVCEKRDPKSLYARARANQLTQMTGVQATYEKPLAPLLSIDTSITDLGLAIAQMLACRNTELHPHRA